MNDIMRAEPYPWGHNRRFNDLGSHYRKLFGSRVQKLSIDAGFTCPNRDGSKGTGGCTFCDNRSFSPGYCSSELSVSEQLQKGMDFFSVKYPDAKYLAYFQSYTNTYGSFDHLVRLYEEALDYPGVSGLVIGTRPDCIDDRLLEYLAEMAGKRYVVIEYGVESTLDATLERINRGHGFAESMEAIARTASSGIPVGVHLILGLPGETPDDMLHHASVLNALPVDFVKLHQLQVLKGTRMEKEYRDFPQDFASFSADEYIDLVIRFLEILKPGIVVERFAGASPPGLIAGNRWGLRSHEVVTLVENEMARRDTWQGRLFA
jgi:radical SAM protein (TIGR01212 family)